MNSRNIKLTCLTLGLGLLSAAAQAKIVQVYGSGQIVAKGTVASNSAFGNQAGFTKVGTELLTVDLAVDGGGVIPAGTWVARHIIFQNVVGTAPSFARAAWEFDGAVLGTISEPTALGLEVDAGDYIVMSGNYAVMTSLVNWMGDPCDWVEVVCASVPDGDGDGVLNEVDDYAASDIRDTVFVMGVDSEIPNDIILVTPDGQDLQGVFLADVIATILEEAAAAAETKYEDRHGDHDHDLEHREKNVNKDTLKFAKDALKVWEKADIISKDEKKVFEKILKELLKS